MNPRIAVPLFTVITFSIGMALTGAIVAPADVWPNVLLSGFFLVGIGLAGGFLIAVHDLSNGRWLGGARRIACSFTRLVLPGSIVLLTALTVGGSTLYPAHDLHGFKGFWLGRAFVIARAFLYIGSWLFIVNRLRNRRGGALYVVVFSLTIWLASVDWIMALEPHWVSTIFGVYHFAGLFTAGLAAILIVAAHRGHEIHDLGKMMFAMSTFWMYIWFSQAMLIWYGNLAEETPYYLRRAFGNWGVLFWITVLLMWVLPFLILLPEKTKRNRAIASRIAVVILIAHWLDLYVSILPASHPQPVLTGWELAIALGTFAAVGWAATRPEPVQVPAAVPVSG
jgi:hypothetical protein